MGRICDCWNLEVSERGLVDYDGASNMPFNGSPYQRITDELFAGCKCLIAVVQYDPPLERADNSRIGDTAVDESSE